MARKKVFGYCAICGTYTKLSFEHVPPRAAFNDRKLISIPIDGRIGKNDLRNLKGKILQRGTGGYTLCSKCNNDTGAWYGTPFVSWSYQASFTLSTSKLGPTLYYPFHLFPLRVIKQIICMFFSLNSDLMRFRHPELVRFILNRETKYLNPELKIYAFYNIGEFGRSSGISAIVDFNNPSSPQIQSEVAFYPLGYIMYFGKHKPDRRLFDISFFANYSYNDWKSFHFKIPLLPVQTEFPGDFRSKEEVQETVRKNKAKYPEHFKKNL